MIYVKLTECWLVVNNSMSSEQGIMVYGHGVW